MKIWEIMDIVELSDDKMGIRKCRSREKSFWWCVPHAFPKEDMIGSYKWIHGGIVKWEILMKHIKQNWILLMNLIFLVMEW